MFEFDQIQDCLGQLAANTDAAEAHGTLCGLLTGRQEFSRWLAFTLDELPDSGDLLAKEQLQTLRELYDQVLGQLNADGIELELLLPDEEQEFALRLLGLAGWCRGFLYGLAVNGEQMLAALSEQGRECMDDLLQISQLAHDEEQNEETETVFTELVEHVRLSVIYIYEELNPVMPAPQVQ